MPFEIEIDTKVAEKAARTLERAPRRMNREILTALRLSAKDVAGATRKLLRQKKGGRSRPGEPPARRTGLLAKSIRFRKARRGLAYRVFHARDAFYGLFLETGATGRRGYVRAHMFKQLLSGGTIRRVAKGASRGDLAPRPFLSRAAEERAAATSQQVQAAIEKTLREAAR